MSAAVSISALAGSVRSSWSTVSRLPLALVDSGARAAGCALSRCPVVVLGVGLSPWAFSTVTDPPSFVAGVFAGACVILSVGGSVPAVCLSAAGALGFPNFVFSGH